MRLLIDPGLLTHADFMEVRRDLDDVQIVGVLLKKKKFSDWHPDKTGLQIWTYEQLENVKSHAERTPYHDHYERLLSIILEDSRTYYLVERLFRGAGLDSVFNNMVKVEHIVWNSLALLYATQPDRIVTTNTPHNTLWFVAKVAELMGIDVYLTAISPLPWKVWVVKSMEKQIPVSAVQLHGPQKEAPTQAINDFIKKIRSHYQDAIPEYEKERMDRYNGGFFNYKIELASIMTSKSLKGVISNIYSVIKKKNAYDTYYAYAKDFVYPDKYIVFFPHFQPERTTLPDGYKYAQQWLAIRTLAEALPADWHLVIKEHPSTFRNRFDPNVRDIQFYDAINALPNVTLAPLNLSPFQLIDKSIGVSTITGTVGIEALIRGKPVIVFGVAQYRGAKGVYFVESIDDVRSVLHKHEIGFEMPNDTELFEYFAWIDRNSFPKEERINSSIEAFRMALTVEM